MRKASLSLLLVVLGATTALAQKMVFEQGKPEELKGVTKVFLAVYNLDARRAILKELNKELPNLIVTTPREAEVWLVFNTSRSAAVEVPGNYSGLIESAAGTVARPSQLRVKGSVIQFVAPNRVRKYIDFKDIADSALTSNLGRSFARAFIKLYRRAN